MQDLDQLLQTVKDKEAAMLAAAAEHSDADASYRAARTATFDSGVVLQARDLGINPDNFDSSDQLQGAVDSQSRPAPAPDEQPSNTNVI